MPNMTKKQRKQVEDLILKTFSILDKSNINTDYYAQMFSSMSDDQFYKWMKEKYPIRFQLKGSTTNPSMSDIKDASNSIGVPLIEKITEPFLYENENGDPVQTKECLVIYTHLKKEQQFITKKNKWSVDIANRDSRNGRLVGSDKGAATSDREFESLVTFGLDKTIEELSGPRADAMSSKNAMYNIISTNGEVSLEDLPKTNSDSSSKNLFNVYLLGSHIASNLINVDGYTPYTLRKRGK